MSDEHLHILRCHATEKSIEAGTVDTFLPILELAMRLERLACERVVHDQAQGEPCCKLEAARLSKVISRRE